MVERIVSLSGVRGVEVLSGMKGKGSEMINWYVTREEHKQIVDIAARAGSIAKDVGIDYPHMQIVMDLSACHANGCPLDLDGLASAAKFDFVHDVFGIGRHINRENGQLEDCFMPRYSLRIHADNG